MHKYVCMHMCFVHISLQHMIVSLKTSSFEKFLKVFTLHTCECLDIYTQYLHCVQHCSLQALNYWVLNGTTLQSLLHEQSYL